jgi:LacI family transcriptional regulator
MTRPTVIDIAREAGVSLATVDRVLNARPGVRAKTITAVNEAISRLGYVRDIAAANLARSRNYRMAVLLPDTESQFVQTLADALREAASTAITARMQVDLIRFPAEDMHALAHRLAGLADQEISGIALMAPETPVVRDAVRALRQRGVPVVALVSDLPNSEPDHYVGIDSRAAGRTAAVLMGRFLGVGCPRVMVISNSMLLRESIERRRGFDEVMLRDFPRVEVLQTLETHGSPQVLRQVVGEMLATVGEVGGIYLLGTGHRALATALSELGLLGRVVIIGHELTPHTRAALQSGWLDAVIAQNVGHIARSTLRVLRAKADRMPIDESQETLRIEVILSENIPAAPI